MFIEWGWMLGVCGSKRRGNGMGLWECEHWIGLWGGLILHSPCFLRKGAAAESI